MKIYKEKMEEKKEIYLKLEERGGDVCLLACDEKGNERYCGQILQINNDGSFYRYLFVGRDLGFQLDEKGKIKEE